MFDQAAVVRRQELQGAAGPMAIVRNGKVFGIACFACLGGLLYGYNQGVFSGVLVMHAFGNHMGDYTQDPSKMGWLTSILELGAWLGTIYSSFLAEIISRKYAILVNVGVFMLGVVVQATAISAGGGHNSILGGRFVTGRMPFFHPRFDPRLTVCRNGRWITFYDRADVQRRVLSARSPRCNGGNATACHHHGNHDFFLDRLR